MKRLLLVLLVLLSITNIFAQDIIIKDIQLIPMTSDTIVAKKSVLIRNGKIHMIGDFQEFPKNEKTTILNGVGRFLMPGLADMHVHLPEEEKIEKLLRANVAAGVTHIRIMNSVLPQLKVKEKLFKTSELISPNIHYSHLITSSDTYTATQAKSLMLQLKRDKIGLVKIISLADEATFENLTKAANENNIIICGHYPVFRNDGKSVRLPIKKVIESNYRSIEHLGGYIWLQGEAEMEEAIQLTKKNNIYNCPTLDWDIMTYNLQYPDAYKKRLTYQFLPERFRHKWEVDYALNIENAGGKEKVSAATDRYKPTYELKLKALKKLYDNDCLLLIGSDPGNILQNDGFNVYEEMVNWSKAGIDNFTILKSATVSPARFLNKSQQWGTIETGKDATLIILQKNPLNDITNITSIETTIMRQKIYSNRTLIDQL